MKIFFFAFLFTCFGASAQVMICYGNQKFDSTSNSWSWYPQWDEPTTITYYPSAAHPIKILYSFNNRFVSQKKIDKWDKDSLLKMEIVYHKKYRFSLWRKTDIRNFTYEKGKPALVSDNSLKRSGKHLHWQKVMKKYFYPDSLTKIEINYREKKGLWIAVTKIISKMENGKIVSEKQYSNSNAYAGSSDTVEWVYNHNNYDYEYIYAYNENGELIKKTHQYAESSEKVWNIYSYSASGDLISIDEYSQKDSLSSPAHSYKSIYEYSPDRKTVYSSVNNTTRTVMIFDEPPLHYVPSILMEPFFL